MLIKLTQHLIDNELSCPDGLTRLELVHNKGRSGLYCVVTKNNRTGTFYLRFKSPSSSKTSHIKLGRTTDISLDDAMKKVAILRTQIAKGIDPREAIKAKKRMPTLNEFFVQDYLPQAKLHQRSWKTTEGIFRRHLKPTLGDKPLEKISLKDVECIHSGLKEKGLAPATINHVSKQARAILNYAVRYDVISVNPVAKVKLFSANNEVNNTLDSEGLGRLLKVLGTHPNKLACLAAKFLLYTGTRKSEMLLSRWENINIESKLWTIPSSDAKSKRSRTVLLNAEALQVLGELGTKGKYEHLWINPKTKKRLTTFYKGWLSIRKAAGLPKMRCHDLRHQFATSMVLAGFSLYQVQIALGHNSSQTSQRYSHLSSKSRQEAVDGVGASMTRALQKAS